MGASWAVYLPITEAHTTQFLFAALAIPSLTCQLTLDTSFPPQIYSALLIFERQDHARQEQIATDTGVPISSILQQVPASADYKQHEIDSNISSPAAIRGQYSQVFLKQFLHSSDTFLTKHIDLLAS